MLDLLPFFCILLWLRLHNCKPSLENDNNSNKKKINSLLIVSRLIVPSVKAYLSICFFILLPMTYLSVHFALVIPLYCQGRCRNECLLCKLENVKTQGSCRPIAAFSVVCIICSCLCCCFFFFFMYLRCVVQPVK